MPVVEVEDDVRGLWNELKRTGRREVRNRLVEKFLHVVRINAERIWARMPNEVDLDDLISAGTFGLMGAIDAYDPRRGIKFETYCAPRIRGAILDELRSMDWVPRLARSRAHRVDAASRQLESELGRMPSHGELARRLNLTDEEFRRVLRDATTIAVNSLSRSTVESNSARELDGLDILPDRNGVDPVHEMLKDDIKQVVTRGLNRAERLVILLYYYEDLTMKEIGSALDLSESRVSQMHTSVMDRLKDHLCQRRRELVLGR
ncbi:MAG: FliA/WhiG family RNA polymerase sigma factor [Phycisphaerales bacterium]|nr:FliA/WhiG family RNA polymerase sigma factor [Phycisphaerales bacterium]